MYHPKDHSLFDFGLQGNRFTYFGMLFDVEDVQRMARRKLFEIFEVLAARASEYSKLKFPVIPIILKGLEGCH